LRNPLPLISWERFHPCAAAVQRFKHVAEAKVAEGAIEASLSLLRVITFDPLHPPLDMKEKGEGGVAAFCTPVIGADGVGAARTLLPPKLLEPLPLGRG